MPPAARIGDYHTCPASTGTTPHVGGPIVRGCPTVFIGGSPAARLGDIAVCNGPPDVIAAGCSSVFIGGQPAARIGDHTAHGGVIVVGCGTVLIGDAPGGGGATGGVLGSASPRGLGMADAVDDGGGWLDNVFAGVDDAVDTIRDAAGQLQQAIALGKRIVQIVKDPVGALSKLLRDAASLGINKLGLKVLGDHWDDVKRIGKLAWKVGKHIPIVRDYLGMAEAFGDNLFDSLALTMLGKVHPFNYMPKGDYDCRCQIPTSDGVVILVDGQGGGFSEVVAGTDVTWAMRSVLEELAPCVLSYADDAPPVGIDDLLSHGKGWGADGKLDLDDGYVSDLRAQRSSHGAAHLTAYKVSDALVLVEVGFLRAVSFMSTARPSGKLRFEHEGDGERAYLFIELVPSANDAHLARGRVVRVVTAVHGQALDPFSDQKTLVFDHSNIRFEGARPIVTIARGSHAVSCASGAVALTTWAFGLSSDCFPDRGEDGVAASTAVVMPGENELGRLYGFQGGERVGEKYGTHCVAPAPLYPVWSHGLPKQPAPKTGTAKKETANPNCNCPPVPPASGVHPVQILVGPPPPKEPDEEEMAREDFPEFNRHGKFINTLVV